MLKVALTGGIATGKSYVLDQFRLRGIPCLDADVLAHGVTAAGTEATQLIAARFGPDVIEAGGAVDRKKLGAVVFADPAARRDLEAIVHPAVYRAINAGLRAFERLGERLVIIDIPLLHESGHAQQFDKVIATICSTRVQLARLLDRGLSEEQAKQRLAAQLPPAEKAARADFVIRTDGTFDDTNVQVDHVISLLTTAANS